MDMSKLPRLSNTPTPPAPEPRPQTTPVQPMDYGRPRSPVSGMAEAWLSFAIAAFILFMYPHLIEYMLHPDNRFDQTSPVILPYLQSGFFKMDLGVTVFGLILILPRNKWLLLGAIIATITTALLNAWVVAVCYNGYGLPVMCALAVALSGYMAIVQWAAFTELRE
jgi:hypothetical protein